MRARCQELRSSFSHASTAIASFPSAHSRGLSSGDGNSAFELDSLEVGEARVGRMQVASYDVAGAGDGLLGRDFLDRFSVNIDSANGVVKPYCCPTSMAAEIGIADMFCTPPATTRSCVPDMTPCAAKCTDCCAEPHCRSMVARLHNSICRADPRWNSHFQTNNR